MTDQMSQNATDAPDAPETLAQALEREHREIDAGIAAYTDGGGPESMSAAVAALRRHIYLEEEFLFPPLRTAGMMMPVFVMVREHAQMWPLLTAVETGIADGSDTAQTCIELVTLLEAHNPKEEQILYPAAEQTLGAEATGALLEFIGTGAMPDGWTAEGLRATK